MSQQLYHSWVTRQARGEKTQTFARAEIKSLTVSYAVNCAAARRVDSKISTRPKPEIQVTIQRL